MAVTEICGIGGEITAERGNIKIIILGRIIIYGAVVNRILIIMTKGTMISIEIIIVQNIINSSDGDIQHELAQLAIRLKADKSEKLLLSMADHLKRTSIENAELKEKIGQVLGAVIKNADCR